MNTVYSCTCLYLTGHINYDHLVKVILSMFFHCEVIIFPFVVDKYFWGEILILYKICSSNFYCLFYSPSLFLVFISYYHCVCLIVIFFIFPFLSVYINWKSTLRNWCPFFSIYLFGHFFIYVWTYRYSFYFWGLNLMLYIFPHKIIQLWLLGIP